jgi:hypothetical protein
MNAFAIIVAAFLTAAPAPQWVKYPTAGIPRLPDGKPNLSAPAPKTPDGKIDISGLWLPGPGYVANIAKDIKPEDVPFQKWAEDLYKQRRATNSKDDPTAQCIVGGVPRSDLVPYPFKILELPGEIVILYEAVHSYRQIFTDGRPFPEDMNPAWFGYSIGRWDGNDFLIQTTGFNDKGWLDNAGRPATEQLKVTERFHRKDFGHMDVVITIDDPKAYTKPWTITLPLTFQADTEILEYICDENNKYFGLDIK